MKKLVVLLLIIPFFSLLNAQSAEDFFGSWKGEDKGEIGLIIFEEDGYATFKMEGQVIGGRSFVMKGKKGKMTYTLDTNNSPIQVDFEVTMEDGGSRKLLAIAQFIDANTLQMAIEFSEVRATGFNDENSILLKRVN